MVFVPQSISFRALMMFLRACGLSSGATASSRSRKITSASDFAAFSNICGALPGTASSLRFRRAGACWITWKDIHGSCQIEELHPDTGIDQTGRSRQVPIRRFRPPVSGFSPQGPVRVEEGNGLRAVLDRQFLEQVR